MAAADNRIQMTRGDSQEVLISRQGDSQEVLILISRAEKSKIV